MKTVFNLSFVLLTTLVITQVIAAAEIEAHYRDAWCEARADFVRTELRVKGGFVDCVLDDYAIEFGFAHKWKEDIAQARWYSLQTGKKAGLVMIYKKPENRVYLRYAQEYLRRYCSGDIKIWVIRAYD